MLNKVMIIGRLGRDPELRYSQAGAPVATLNIATDESYTDREGNKVDRTEWHRVVVFQRAAENCANYLAKGSLVFVEGNLQTQKWQDEQGQNRYATEIHAQRVQFLDRRGDSAGAEAHEGGARSGGHRSGGPGSGGPSSRVPGSGGQGRAQRQSGGVDYDEIGPVSPSEASDIDEVPF